jgi:hypothetical protein
MRLYRAAQDAANAPSSAVGAPFTAGPVVLFIGAVLIAGMTCILYLWQQSRIVAGQQDILQLNAQLTQLTQQRNYLLAQEDSLRSVPNIVAHAVQYGMTQSTPAHHMQLPAPAAPTPLVAQATGDQQPAVILPATNAAITSWWQDAWDSLYNLLQ